MSYPNLRAAMRDHGVADMDAGLPEPADAPRGATGEARRGTYRFRLTYNSPLGFRIREYEAETYEAGYDEAKRYCDRPCASMVSLECEREAAGEAAHDCGERPRKVAGEQLDPDEVAPREDDEHARHGDGLRPSRRVKHDVVLLVGKRNEVKVTKLLGHRRLVSGTDEVRVFHAGFKVSDLLRVLANLEEEDEQVQGHGVHGDHHQG